MNQITVAGHLGADPETRFTSSGQKVTTLRVATRTRRSSPTNDETIWWRVTIWGDQFDRILGYFKKGSPIIVVGDLSKPEIFTGRDGQPQVSMNITAYHIGFSPFGRSQSQEEKGEEGVLTAVGQQSEQGQGQKQEHQQGHADASPFNDDEIPF